MLVCYVVCARPRQRQVAVVGSSDGKADEETGGTVIRDRDLVRPDPEDDERKRHGSVCTQDTVWCSAKTTSRRLHQPGIRLLNRVQYTSTRPPSHCIACANNNNTRVVSDVGGGLSPQEILVRSIVLFSCGPYHDCLCDRRCHPLVMTVPSGCKE